MLALVLAAVALAAPAAAAPPTHTARAAKAATPVGVGEREWSVSAYRSAVRPGRVSFNVHNYGEDAHNLQISGPHGYRSKVTPDIEAGGNGRLVATLARRGTYSLLCIKPGHLAKGMRTTIRVR